MKTVILLLLSGESDGYTNSPFISYGGFLVDDNGPTGIKTKYLVI